ncbi:MAG: bifunctional (p)ppGpp synthetase/guanosine-3',5'-bis(diphosphate) 3'-pyrophosphohydrolase [Firmicutes bacterium]|nr:bifunctional (p)ppGpp synthetase/guanosine-3',5'-bis(diphosphate) 3'-pyrophosphohydrolase [Bacillota bacterium]
MDAFIEELLSYNPSYNAELLTKAYEKAKELHKDQKRKSGEPYIIHPMAVAKILAELGVDDVGIASGLLHDVVEDTSYSLEQLEADFGPEIALIVDGVTKLTSFEFSSKIAQQNETIRKMFLAMTKDIRVLVIKLADRLHNLRTINYMTEAKIKEKCTETLEIYAPLASRLGMYAFKFEMEDICFKNLMPEEYNALYTQMEERKREKGNNFDKYIEEIKNGLSPLNIKYEIYGRQKHFYSIYKKMNIQHKQLDEIFDLIAIRIIVDTVSECYAVLGVVHTLWKPIPGRFKDYIAMPKPNLYQSLHTTVVGENGYPFEIQIRTKEMHRVAEYGIAAHWKYKEGISDKDGNEEAKLAWLRQTLEWQKEVSSSEEFVTAVKMDLFTNQVFVFSPKGDVMELPYGSTPLDFAYKVHTAVGNKCVGAKVNGKIVPIDYTLQNGDLIDIITSSNSNGPSIDWLKIVKTNHAKNKIRQSLKKLDKSLSSDRGKEMLEKACRHKGYEPEQILLVRYLEKATKAQNFSALEDLYTAISGGGVALNRTVLLCANYYHEEKQAELIRQEKEEAKKLAALNKRPRIERTGGVKVKGVDNLLIRFARCCNPVPGDEIVGYTTKGRGISIHRKDCVNMLALPDEERVRLIDVEWDISSQDMHFNASLTIIAEDRKGLIIDISKACDELDINIEGIQSKTDKFAVATFNLQVAINNLGDFDKLTARLKQIDSIVQVYRTNGE